MAALGVIPGVGGSVSVVAGLWGLVTGIVAIRQALDFGTGKAILTAIISMVVIWALIFALGLAVALLFVA